MVQFIGMPGAQINPRDSIIDTSVMANALSEWGRRNRDLADREQNANALMGAYNSMNSQAGPGPSQQPPVRNALSGSLSEWDPRRSIGAPPPRAFDSWQPHNLLLHDYGGSPKNEDGMNNPYHALVFPDGSIRYRNPDDPYGSKSPHAYKMNGDAIGLSYAGPVGSQPTPQAMATLKSEYDKINQMFPDIKTMSHGEAYEATKGTNRQASRDGRGLDEASWRTAFSQPAASFPPQTSRPVQVAQNGRMSPEAFRGLAAAPGTQDTASAIVKDQYSRANPTREQDLNYQSKLTETQRASLEFYGKQASAVMQIPEGPQRAAIWQRILAKHNAEHPGEHLTPEEMDPVTGPQLMAAQAGLTVDPIAKQMEEAKLGLLKGQTKALDQKDALNEAIAEMIKGGAAPAQAQPPPIQPQSFNGQAPQSGLILTADGQPAPQAPQAAPPADMIDTPYGKMTREKAVKLGGAMLLNPQYAAAGKALVDAAQGGGPTGLGKTADNQNDKEEIAATNQVATLDNVKRSYDAKFLNIPARFKLWGNALASKFGTLNPKDQEDLKAYTTFRQSSWHNLNRVLKDLSGTAVTENEMQRQLLDQPNPGQGVFDGDAPAEFDAKLKGQIAFAHSAVARARYLRAKGFTGKPWEAGVAVEDMPKIINERGAQLEQQLKQQNPNANPMQLQEAVKGQIKKEFGI